MKKILVLGGTRFIGRNLVEKLIDKNDYTITLFNRGVSDSKIFQELNHIKGDRKSINDLQPILTQDWDVVVDCSCYWANALEKQLENRKGRVGKYIFISTSSHYKFDEKDKTPIEETREIVGCTEEQKQSEEPYAFYNEKKAECERILAQQSNLNYLILRPSLVIGNFDYSDRLYYWLYKVKHQSKILVGSNGNTLSSYTNVNDLVDLIVHAMDKNTNHKVYNVSSFDASLRDIIKATGNILSCSPKLISAETKFLHNNEIFQWTSLPLWLDANYFRFDNNRAKNEFNYEFRDMHESIEALVDFYANDQKWREPKTKPTPISNGKEQEVISKIEKEKP